MTVYDCYCHALEQGCLIEGLRAAAEEAGRPELLLANNEYGLGKPNSLTGFNRFTKVLM